MQRRRVEEARRGPRQHDLAALRLRLPLGEEMHGALDRVDGADQVDIEHLQVWRQQLARRRVEAVGEEVLAVDAGVAEHGVEGAEGGVRGLEEGEDVGPGGDVAFAEEDAAG